MIFEKRLSLQKITELAQILNPVYWKSTRQTINEFLRRNPVVFIKSCEWTCYEPSDGDYFEGHFTECGESFMWFVDDDIENFENREFKKGRFKFCPYCGGEISETVVLKDDEF